MVNAPMRIVLSGIVQGVGFRPSVHRLAHKLGINGSVHNDGSRVVVDLDYDAHLFMNALQKSLPPLAEIESFQIFETPYNGEPGFQIIPSQTGSRGVGIPTDTALCPYCIAEMKSPADRRHNYPFISCTDCGPRFTLISDLPYDRRTTAMDAFPFCPQCDKEYSSPSDRRYHHQTICCSKCGPQYTLFDGTGLKIDIDPIQGFAQGLKEGKIGIVKSWGGMHICCLLNQVDHLRDWYRRKEKPFAIMLRDLSVLNRYALATEEEIALLESPQRPVVLLNKIANEFTEKLSPGLDDLGIFLPYAAVHHLLFQELKDDALIMTSANPPGEPMHLDDRSAFGLGADLYLLHNQKILNRADDSVISIYNHHKQFLRKSRGHTPSYISINLQGQAIGLGGQENISACVSHAGRLYSTQYIGDGDKLGVLEYLDSSITHLRHLMGIENCLDIIGLDLHPGYSNRPLAKRLAEETGAPIMEIQHHWAHAASLLVDAEVNEAVVLTLDGTGYGDDGKAWGGEVIHCDLSQYQRVGKLQDIPLLGGERALYDLRRLNYAIDRLNGEVSTYFTEREQAVLDKMMDLSVGCSSMGRVMDALSSQLGVCRQRTYDGEPAMKLERLLRRGKRHSEVIASSNGGQISTAPLFAQVRDLGLNAPDAAFSLVAAVLEELVAIACQKAESEKINYIGLSGGVSYNAVVCDIVSKAVKQNDMNLILHNRVPNGDGGLAVGQAAIALRSLT